MKRSERLKEIKKLILDKKVSSQNEILEELRKKGFAVTQSTISRDINYLNLNKVVNYNQEEFYTTDNSYKSKPVYDMSKMKSKFNESVIKVSLSDCIIVIKTMPGEAQSVCVVLDGMNFVEILGTVAGDDTIISVIDKKENAKKIYELLKKL